MSLRFEVLLAALRLESLTKAAQQTGYTQSGITHLLNSMEKEWGITLLIRSKKENIITPEGKEILPYLQNLVNAHRLLEEKVSSIKGNETGLVRIGSITSISTNILPDLLASFNRIYPGIRFEIDHLSFTEIERALMEETLDVGFLQDKTSGNALTCFPFYSDEAVAVLPNDYFKNDKNEEEKFSPQAFNENPFIMIGVHEGAFHQYLHEQGIKTAVPFIAQEDELAAALIEKHLGIGMGYRLSLKRSLSNVILKSLNPPLTREIVLAIKQGDHKSLALESFLSFISTYNVP